jgi:ribosomal protein L19
MSDILLRKSKVIQNQLRTDLPKFVVGSVISVYYKYQEGDKTRTKIVKGLVTNLHAVKDTSNPKTLDASFTVVKISEGNIKLQLTFPLNSPAVEKVIVHQLQRARRSNLNQLAMNRKNYQKTGKFKSLEKVEEK